MIRIENLTVSYARKLPPVLNDVSCSVPRGKITVLVGPNGSGKSTLLRTICGFLPPRAGNVFLDGKNLREYALSERARKIAFLSQVRSLPEITVRRLVLHGRFPYTKFPRRYSQADLKVAEDVLRALNLTALADSRLSELSGGQQQKACLAMALAQETPALVLDEPLTFLDIRQQLELIHLLKDLRAQGKTVLLVVHDLQTALGLADKLIVLSGGRVLAEGNPDEIARQGTIDSVFGVRTEMHLLPQGIKLYAFVESDSAGTECGAGAELCAGADSASAESGGGGTLQ